MAALTLRAKNKNPSRAATGGKDAGEGSGPHIGGPTHFCHVRFLWRFAFKRFLRLCLFIFSRRFFFRLPMVRGGNRATHPPGCKAEFGAPAKPVAGSETK